LGIYLLNISDEKKRELLTLKLKKPDGPSEPSDNEEKVEEDTLKENEEDEVEEQ